MTRAGRQSPPPLLFAPFMLGIVAVLLIASCRSRPVLHEDFETPQSLDALHWSCGAAYSLSEKHAASGRKSLRLDLYPASSGSGNNYPGVSFADFNRNWKKHRALQFAVFNPEVTPIRLTVRIDDRKKPDYDERFNKSFLIAPGGNRLSLPLEELVTSGTRRRLDLQNIELVVIFLANPTEKHTLYIDNVRLD